MSDEQKEDLVINPAPPRASGTIDITLKYGGRPEPPGEKVRTVGCEREDGTLNVHAESAACEVCEPQQVMIPGDWHRIGTVVFRGQEPVACFYGEDYIRRADEYIHLRERLGAAEQRAEDLDAEVECLDKNYAALRAERDRLKEQLAGVEATHRKEINEMAREHSREIRDAVAEARWADGQEGDYGSY